jgi:hypothetical protein
MLNMGHTCELYYIVQRYVVLHIYKELVGVAAPELQTHMWTCLLGSIAPRAPENPSTTKNFLLGLWD